MRQAASTRTTTRRAFRPGAVGLVVVIAVTIGTLVYRSASSIALPSSGPPSGAQRVVPLPATPSAAAVIEVPRRELGRALPQDDGGSPGVDGGVTEVDGALPDGVTPFDDEYPGIANLDPDLLEALQRAATDAADDGVRLSINSGWRSTDYQDRLLRTAVAQYGSEAEAARWVATADTSPHVFGDAVDIGSVDGTAWLSNHGARYGLCQIYRNEPWHHELRPQAVDGRCPRMYADPTHDPRMQR